MSVRPTSSVHRAVREALSGHERAVLAVSGGLDSMTLLHAAAAVVDRRRLVVATFDHGTGPAATAAREVVAERCRDLDVECIVGRADKPLTTEADFRSARWGFLRAAASARSAPIVTAHTQDDQVETVLMRVLRGAGARGLAGLYAKSDIIRPLLRLTRSDLANYAAAERVSWIDDPSNASPRFFRNRIRHEILPALRGVRPELDAELLAVARAAAALRSDVDAYVDAALDVRRDPVGGLDVSARAISGHSPRELAVLWPAVAARAGVTLDRRGILRLAAFTATGRVGARVQVAGGWEVIRSRDAFQLRASPGKEDASPRESVVPDRGLEWGKWSFRPSPHPIDGDRWSAVLPGDRPVVVRPWRDGDVMTVRLGSRATKVKKLLSKAGVTGHDRAGWPVVLSGGRIVWIPGVSRSDAAAARSGRPGLPFVCEYTRR